MAVRLCLRCGQREPGESHRPGIECRPEMRVYPVTPRTYGDLLPGLLRWQEERGVERLRNNPEFPPAAMRAYREAWREYRETVLESVKPKERSMPIRMTVEFEEISNGVLVTIPGHFTEGRPPRYFASIEQARRGVPDMVLEEWERRQRCKVTRENPLGLDPLERASQETPPDRGSEDEIDQWARDHGATVFVRDSTVMDTSAFGSGGLAREGGEQQSAGGLDEGDGLAEK